METKSVEVLVMSTLEQEPQVKVFLQERRMSDLHADASKGFSGSDDPRDWLKLRFKCSPA